MKKLLLIGLLSTPSLMAMHPKPKANESTIQEVLKIVVEEQRRFEGQLQRLEEYWTGEKMPADISQKVEKLRSNIQTKEEQANKLIAKAAK